MKKVLLVVVVAILFILPFLFTGCDELPTTPGGPDDASLSALTLSSGTLTPTFASATPEYTVALDGGTTSIIITPTATNPASVIKVDDVVTASGTASAAVILAEGLNTVAVEVTSEDGSTVKNYTLKITVGEIPTVKVSGTLTINQIIPDGQTQVGKNFIVGIIADFTTEPIAMYQGIWGSGMTQDYELNNVPAGTYYLYALIDWNDEDEYDGVYPNYAGLHGYTFDSLSPYFANGDSPAGANLTIADIDLTADITEIEEIPLNTLTVELINAGDQDTELFGFAVFEDDDVIIGNLVASGGATISTDTASSPAYIDPTAPSPVAYPTVGGEFYDIHVMIDKNTNGVTDLRDWVGMLDDVQIAGDTTATVDYDTQMIEYLPAENGIGVSLTGGTDSQGEAFIFAVYPSDVAPEQMTPDNYLASGVFQIAFNGTGSGLAMDDSDSLFIGSAGTDYNILVFIDSITSNIEPDDGELYSTYSITLSGKFIQDVDYADDLNPFDSTPPPTP